MVASRTTISAAFSTGWPAPKSVVKSVAVNPERRS
jgi:hypothetical protein